MARKQNPRPTKEAPPPKEESSEDDVEEEEEVEEEVVEEKPKKAGKSSRKTVTVAKPVEETPKKGAGKKGAGKKAASKKAVPVSENEKPVRKSRTITQEDVTKDFEDLLEILDKEISRVKELPEKGKGKGTGIQFLRGVKKRTKMLQNSTNRVMKQKQKIPRKNNNSGFLKPVLISEQMAGFTGWDQSKPTSRVEVTRFLCKYIKDNDLQNPKDRRQITADEKLSKLLNYYPKKGDNPLTYYSMQTYMKPHFEKIENAAVAAA